MKGLAWYSGGVTAFGLVSCAIEGMQGINFATNVWAVVMYAPVIVFFVLYLKEKK
jgi:hypothetical protein